MVTSRFVAYSFWAMAILGSCLNSAQAADKDDADARSEIAIMQALLTEVRQLRAEIRYMAAINNRAQLTMQQMHLQEQRLTHASVQLDEIRKQISSVSAQRTEATNKIEGIEATISQRQDQKLATDMEGIIANLKQTVERLSAAGGDSAVTG